MLAHLLSFTQDEQEVSFCGICAYDALCFSIKIDFILEFKCTLVLRWRK